MEKILINSQQWKNLRENTANIQSRQCAICRVDLDLSSRGPQLDHDHDTGLIRGALCFSCNHHLGWYERKKNVVEHYLRSRIPTHQVETPKERAARKLAHRRREIIARLEHEDQESEAAAARRRRK